jgi:soluble lytic murein transglycosylase
MCDWLDGLGSSAQARADGLGDAFPFARRALEARPAGRAGARAQLEVALALEGSGGPADRVAALRAALPGADPGIRSAALFALGEALLAGGEPEEGAQAFRDASLEGGSAFARRARLRAASALHASGLPAQAVQLWRPLATDRLATSLDTPSRIAFARDLRATGERTRAAEILRAVWLELPERPEAAEAEAALSSFRAAGDPIAPFTGEERIARAYRLASLGRASEGRAELDKAANGEPPPPSEILELANATILLGLGQPSAAALRVAPLARSTNPGIRRGAALVSARAAARERRIPDAIAAWKAVAASSATIPGLSPAAQSALRDDAPYFAAWLHLDTADLERASRELSELARRHPRSRRADDARWFSAWALIRKGALSEAEAALERLEAGDSLLRARYWRARITADPAVATRLLASVAAADPLGYYGLLSCSRLAAAGAPCAAAPLSAGRPPPELNDLSDAPRLRRAALLAAHGFRDEAIAELAGLSFSNGGRLSAPLAAELAHFLEDPLLPFRVARDQLGLSRRTLAWSYPEAWPRLVAAAAEAARVDPTLLRAVMRRESGFRTEARSPAGAVGLLQIVPSTAARLSALLRLPEADGDRLEEPSVNIPLGAGYLALLVERFGDPMVAIAAYNAGPNAVLRWTRGQPTLPLDEWVESIPFRETRQYVRAVVENWAGARAAAGQPPPTIDPARAVPAPAAGVAF